MSTKEDPTYEELAAKAKQDNCSVCGRTHAVSKGDQTINLLTVIRKDWRQPDYAKGNLITVCRLCKKEIEN
jgi:hypothetical protein